MNNESFPLPYSSFILLNTNSNPLIIQNLSSDRHITVEYERESSFLMDKFV